MSKTLTAWLLFLIQFACAAVFGLSQFWQMLSSTEGISMSWFAAWEVFLLLNLWLAWRAHRVQPSLVTAHTLIIYAAFTVLIGLDLSVILIRRSWTWGGQDTLTAQIIAAGVAATLLINAWRRQPISNPLVKGWLAVFFKSVPQLVLAWSVHLNGGQGLAPAAVVAGHITILMRLGQLTIAIREAGWDKNRIASFISEVPNELSWIVVTIVWLT